MDVAIYNLIIIHRISLYLLCFYNINNYIHYKILVGLSIIQTNIIVVDILTI
jgi:hypothetical protein